MCVDLCVSVTDCVFCVYVSEGVCVCRGVSLFMYVYFCM